MADIEHRKFGEIWTRPYVNEPEEDALDDFATKSIDGRLRRRQEGQRYVSWPGAAMKASEVDKPPPAHVTARNSEDRHEASLISGDHHIARQGAY